MKGIFKLVACLFLFVSLQSYSNVYTDPNGRFSINPTGLSQSQYNSTEHLEFYGSSCRWEGMMPDECMAYDTTVYFNSGMPNFWQNLSWPSIDRLDGDNFHQLSEADQLTQMGIWISDWVDALDDPSYHVYTLSDAGGGYQVSNGAIYKELSFEFTSGGPATWVGTLGIIVDGQGLYSYMIQHTANGTSNSTYQAESLVDTFATNFPHPNLPDLILDSDNDGIPDSIETAYGTNPNDPSDGGAAELAALEASSGSTKNVPAMGGIGLLALGLSMLGLGAVRLRK